MTGLLLMTFICVGFALGKLSNKLNDEKLKKLFLKVVSSGQMASIVLLLTMMGYKIGSNEEIIKSFSTIGLHSIIFGVSTLFMSAIITFLFVKLQKLFKEKRNDTLSTTVHIEEETPTTGHNFVMISVFLGLVFLGGITGYFNFINIAYDVLVKIVDYSLFALVFFIGIDMGTAHLTIKDIKSIGKSVAIICLGVVIGSLLGSLIPGLLMGYDALFSISVGSAMGWYSLSGIMLSSVNESLGAISFSANLIRELLAMALVPLIGSFLSPESAIACCGATAMDTSLPAITKGLGKQYAVTGFACGIIISAIVPFFLSIIQIIYGIM